ncbi:MAG: hypothetical protein KC419_17355 [Anaerolineales bacterium]|nr:hypothetical protein [Anaerolineales bacterium]
MQPWLGQPVGHGLGVWGGREKAAVLHIKKRKPVGSKDGRRWSNTTSRNQTGELIPDFTGFRAKKQALSLCYLTQQASKVILDSSNPSPDILEGQRILLEKRAELGITGQQRPLPDGRVPSAPKIDETKSHLPETAVTHYGAAKLEAARLRDAIAAGPDRIDGKTAVDLVREMWDRAQEETAVSSPSSPEISSQEPHKILVNTFLWCASNKRKEQAIFKLQTHLDHMRNGRAWLSIDEIKTELVETAVYKWDTVYRMLVTGHLSRWDYDPDRGRVWAYKPARVAQNIGMSEDEINVEPAYIPITEAADGLERFNTAVFAAWLAGVNAGGDAPISRAVQSDLTGLSPRTLRKYTQLSNAIQRESNYTRDGDWTQDNIQDVFYQHETAVFRFEDGQGRQGRAGRVYAAREIPSTYHVNYPIRKGKKRKIKRSFRDLADNGTLRNTGAAFDHLYFENGKEAATAVSRGNDAYWPMRAVSGVSKFTGNTYQFWSHVH